MLLTLDREKINRAIRDMEADQQLADLAIRLAELELPIAERSAPLDMAEAEQAKGRADEDLRKFLEVDRPLAVENAEFGVKNSAHRLNIAEEELKRTPKNVPQRLDRRNRGDHPQTSAPRGREGEILRQARRKPPRSIAEGGTAAARTGFT